MSYVGTVQKAVEKPPTAVELHLLLTVFGFELRHGVVEIGRVHDVVAQKNRPFLHPPIAMITDSGTPARRRFLAPVRRRSWIRRSESPTAILTLSHSLRKFVPLKTAPSLGSTQQSRKLRGEEAAMAACSW